MTLMVSTVSLGTVVFDRQDDGIPAHRTLDGRQGPLHEPPVAIRQRLLVEHTPHLRS
jgi:hypothetical protein